MDVVLVEDHLMFRDVLRKICVSDCGLRVVAETGCGKTAIELILKHRPTLALIDLGIPTIDGISVITQVQSACPDTAILVVSCHLDDYTLMRLGSLQIAGFVDKNSTSLPTLSKAIKTVMKGGKYFSPGFLAARAQRQIDSRAIYKRLTRTECAVLVAIGDGANDDEIGQRLEISAATAQKHRANLFKKLGVASSAKLVAFAVQHGFTSRTIMPPFG
jgi:DNA-binding NarL/FixJ family response regulator